MRPLEKSPGVTGIEHNDLGLQPCEQQAHHAVLQEEGMEGDEDGLVPAVAAPVPAHACECAAHLALHSKHSS